MVEPGPSACVVCGHHVRYIGTGDYYMAGVPQMHTPLFRCGSCGALTRQVSEEAIRSHYNVATYTDPRFEDRFSSQRKNFFRSLAMLVTRYSGRAPRNCLDFGCSYGHFLQVLQDQQCEVYGIECSERARDICQKHNLRVYERLDEIEGSARFDLVSLIDSLYYVSDPKMLLSRLRERLADDGHLLIRITNRNWIVHLLSSVGRREHFDYWLGDAIVCYTKSALYALLCNSGYRIVSTHYWESGKENLGWQRNIFYWLTSFITCASLGSVVISPGIVVLAEKEV